MERIERKEERKGRLGSRWAERRKERKGWARKEGRRRWARKEGRRVGKEGIVHVEG